MSNGQRHLHAVPTPQQSIGTPRSSHLRPVRALAVLFGSAVTGIVVGGLLGVEILNPSAPGGAPWDLAFAAGAIPTGVATYLGTIAANRMRGRPIVPLGQGMELPGSL